MTTETETSPSVHHYWELLKPRVMSLVIFTAFCGLWMATGSVHPVLAFTAVLCIAVGAGAAGCLNMWFERDTDKLMKRTMMRPVAQGLIHPDSSLAFGIVLSFLSIIICQVAIGTITAIWLTITIVSYILYTVFLKPNTPQNIVIGGIAGALPPVIGWSAVAPLDVRPWSLFLIIFLWTPAHFWALALNHAEDYKKAELPMMPNTAGIKKTKKYIMIYAILTVISAIIPYTLQMAGWFYLGCVLGFGAGFIFLALQLYKSEDSQDGIKVFAFSILFLFVIFAALIIDRKSYG